MTRLSTRSCGAGYYTVPSSGRIVNTLHWLLLTNLLRRKYANLISFG